MNIKSNKKNKIITFLIILSLISGFLQSISLSQKNQILTNTNLFNEERVNNIKTATIIESDWETSRGAGSIVVVDKPSGTQNGDLLIFHCTIDDVGDPLQDPIGWTDLLPENQSGGQTTASWYKIAGDSEPINYNVSWEGYERYVAGIIRITGHNSNNPIQTTATANGTGNIINPSLTTTRNNTLIIGFHGLDDDDQGDNYDDDLELGPTVLYARTSLGPRGECSAGMYYEIQSNQGVSPNRTWSIGGDEGWYAATVAINPEVLVINIVSPTENEIFEDDAPDFVIEIRDPDLDTMWYTVDGGLHNYTFTTNSTINEVAWDALPDGTIAIRFYANNSLGDINFEEVNVIKDTSAPIINIISPTENEKFGVAAPDFSVEITDLNLDTMWYSIYNASIEPLNITFTVNGTINQNVWDALWDGPYTIRFYANDTLGNINFEEVDVIKDKYAIVINIISPTENEVFDDAPSFIVEISCAFLNMTWYTLNGGENKYFTDNGTIDGDAWAALPDGIVTIRFSANNTIGDINFEEVNVIKDTSAPIINIVSPTENEIFGVDAPSFEVEITDLSLDTMWYTLDNGLTNITFNEQVGTINQTIWNALPDGTVTIRFYANDTLGNINFEEVNITKDIYAIFIDIVSPIENEMFGGNAPNFIVEISCSFLNITWYTLDGGLHNYTFTTNGTINQAAWAALSDGTITIRFYANNTLGDIDFEQVNVIKDSSAPIINIVSPTENEKFEVDAPSFEVEVTDLHLDKMWYTINENATKFFFTQDGTIDQTAWDALADGNITLTFYANDTLGNLAFEEIVIVKSTPSEEVPDNTLIIIIVSIIAGIAVIGLILGILVKKGKISLKKPFFRKKIPTEKIPDEV